MVNLAHLHWAVVWSIKFKAVSQIIRGSLTMLVDKPHLLSRKNKKRDKRVEIEKGMT